MRILIDECLNWRLGRAHRALCSLGAKNGLERHQEWKAAGSGSRKRFRCLLTGDRNLTFQQNTTEFSIAIVVLEAKGIQLHHTLPLIPKVIALLPTLKPGQVLHVRP